MEAIQAFTPTEKVKRRDGREKESRSWNRSW
jgi:hypothetical protein